jgi:hypothetical protein
VQVARACVTATKKTAKKTAKGFGAGCAGVRDRVKASGACCLHPGGRACAASWDSTSLRMMSRSWASREAMPGVHQIRYSQLSAL